jgi:hypothetical protein
MQWLPAILYITKQIQLKVQKCNGLLIRPAAAKISESSVKLSSELSYFLSFFLLSSEKYKDFHRLS